MDMNPYEIERLAKQHTSDIRKAAAKQHARSAHRDHGRTIRHRTGWALIQIGLSLISTPSGGPKSPAMRPSLSAARSGR
jgi:hypothetical protein